MPTSKNLESAPKIGKFILDTISIGMYNDPLMILREYIQNSADSIDKFKKSAHAHNFEPRIDINVDGASRILTIKDNGFGVTASEAQRVLHDLGESSKKTFLNRGFRGVGRLGGLGYCDQLKFITKAYGEKFYSESVWDCNKLRSLIGTAAEKIDAGSAVRSVVSFSQMDYSKNERDHFFIVELVNLKSSKNALLDVPVIKAYLSQTAPVPFDKKQFHYASKIDAELRAKVPGYETYSIAVNGEQVLKPYKDQVRISKEQSDPIKDIDYVEFHNGTGPLAFGWLAKLNLLGAINPKDRVEGIRVRSGNILVGNKDLLAHFYREARFNNYVVGEIHIAHPCLVLNSRRDDFEDNPYKEEFYNNFVRAIGLPFSQKIRLSSRERSAIQKTKRVRQIRDEGEGIVKDGYFSEAHYKDILKELQRIRKNSSDEAVEIDNLMAGMKKSKHYLDNIRDIKITKEHLKKIFDIVYADVSDSARALQIIKKALSPLLKNK